MVYRVAADIGGTFTDIVIENTSDKVFSTIKVLSTPQNPAIAVLEGLKKNISNIDEIDIVDQNSPNNGSVKVFSNESTGESNLITCKMEDQSLIIKADKNTNYDIDNEIFLNLKKEDCYFFDSKSEDRLKL